MENPVTDQTSTGESATQIDEIQLRTFLQQAKDNQNLALALIGGIGASVVGAAIWAMVTVWTGYQIGWMAVGVGFLVGFAVRLMGNGIDRIFGIVGAILALLGCLAGNLLMVCIMISRQEGIMLVDLLSRLSLPVALQLMVLTFRPMDLLFYGIAIYEGYNFSFLRFNLEDITKTRHG